MIGSDPRALVNILADDPLPLAAILQSALDRSGLTKADLARAAGMSDQMLAKLFRPDHNTTIDTARKVLRALGVTLAPVE